MIVIGIPSEINHNHRGKADKQILFAGNRRFGLRLQNKNVLFRLNVGFLFIKLDNVAAVQPKKISV